MPSAVVVAVAALAALTLGLLGPPSVGLAGAGLILVGSAVRLARDAAPARALGSAPSAKPTARVARRRLGDRLRLLPLGIGVVAIGLRGLMPAAGPLPALPDGSGPWVAGVEIGRTPRDGNRPAILAIESPPIRVAATLPWYPPGRPQGDRVDRRRDPIGARG